MNTVCISRERSYAWCAQAARRAASNFYWSFYVLPPAKRRAMLALYAFARHSDDLADDGAAGNEQELEEWRQAFAASLRGDFRHPLLPALVDTIERFQIPIQLLYDVLDGVEMDLDHHSPETFADWTEYCDRVASAVGLACVHIWGFSDRAVMVPATRCGWAFQLTNILRDLGEDAEQGRVYLPLEDLRRFDCSRAELLRREANPNVRALVKWEIARAEQLFAAAVVTRDYLRGGGRRAFDLMFGRYRALLRQVAARGDQLFGPRVRVGPWRKILIAARGTLGLSANDPRTALVESPRASSNETRTVAIVGGGLAGLAAAAALCDERFQVTLFESCRQLGGRAGSFTERETGECIDHCQHVGMGCCHSLIAFAERTGVSDLFRRDQTIYFFGPNGRRYRFGATPGLPAPFHLATSLLRASYLTWRDRLRIAWTLRQLQQYSTPDDHDSQTIATWLRQHGASDNALRRFWNVVLVSALGESLDRASVAAARKVFVDGFMTDRDGYELLVPRVPLSKLYGQIAGWLQDRGVDVRLDSHVTRIDVTAHGAPELNWSELRAANELHRQEKFDDVVVAVPWRRIAAAFPIGLEQISPVLARIEELQSSPITSLHLWFDRPFMTEPHAMLVDRLAQWVFQRDFPAATTQSAAWSYYQVVISASRSIAAVPREQLIRDVLNELASVWPVAKTAKLMHARLITQPDAVFSYQPGLDRIRPDQSTSFSHLFLAGDWTRTGWPATLEGAVRSGNLAAAEIVARLRRPSNRKHLHSQRS